MSGIVNHQDVLDCGHVTLLDIFGDDFTVVEAARVSTGSESSLHKDIELIKYLMEHGHETPFEQVMFRWKVKCPIFVARQWMRHRWASYNEQSARYKAIKDEFYIPDLTRLPSTITQSDIDEYTAMLDQCHKLYKNLLKKASGVKLPALSGDARARAREVFRGLLGTAFYTEFYFVVNFRSLMNFFNLRSHTDAQYEIRAYSHIMEEMVKKHVPLLYGAYIDKRSKK